MDEPVDIINTLNLPEGTSIEKALRRRCVASRVSKSGATYCHLPNARAGQAQCAAPASWGPNWGSAAAILRKLLITQAKYTDQNVSGRRPSANEVMLYVLIPIILSRINSQEIE